MADSLTHYLNTRSQDWGYNVTQDRPVPDKIDVSKQELHSLLQLIIRFRQEIQDLRDQLAQSSQQQTQSVLDAENNLIKRIEQKAREYLQASEWEKTQSWSSTLQDYSQKHAYAAHVLNQMLENWKLDDRG